MEGEFTELCKNMALKYGSVMLKRDITFFFHFERGTVMNN